MGKKNQIEIIYEDDDLLVVNKSPGLLSVPDRFKHDLPNVLTIAGGETDLFIVHRLDRYTSGLLVLAKNAEAHRNLSMAFEERKVQKTYLAIVDGKPQKNEGEIDAPLAESQATRGKMLVHKRGKSSLSRYHVLENYGPFSLVSIELFTGRTHQARVHMAHIGHPLMVDPLYGSREAFYLSEIKKRKFKIGKFDEEQPLLKRYPLHAWRLAFQHPMDGKPLSFEVEMPKDMRAVMNQLKKIYV